VLVFIGMSLCLGGPEKVECISKLSLTDHVTHSLSIKELKLHSSEIFGIASNIYCKQSYAIYIIYHQDSTVLSRVFNSHLNITITLLFGQEFVLSEQRKHLKRHSI